MTVATDEYRTIRQKAEASYSEKRSKFLAFAIPVSTVEEVKDLVAQYSKQYYDARHACYAYMLGPERQVFRANDNGEPSGTAGKPILGQINSHELTDILIIVIRYFGGIKLGTSGLIQAYRQAALEAIQNADIIVRTVDDDIRFSYDFPQMNSVMKIVKDLNPRIIGQEYDNRCQMTIRIRQSLSAQLRTRLQQVETLRFEG